MIIKVLRGKQEKEPVDGIEAISHSHVFTQQPLWSHFLLGMEMAILLAKPPSMSLSSPM